MTMFNIGYRTVSGYEIYADEKNDPIALVYDNHPGHIQTLKLMAQSPELFACLDSSLNIMEELIKRLPEPDPMIVMLFSRMKRQTSRMIEKLNSDDLEF